MASERVERWREREEGSGEGGYSGKGERSAGRGEWEAGRMETQKKPNPLGLGLGWGEGWVSVGRVDRQSRLSTRQSVGVGWGVPCTVVRMPYRLLSVPTLGLALVLCRGKRLLAC